MSRSINRVTLLGYVGGDPEVSTTSAGTAMAKFSVATSEKWTDDAGETRERTDWHRIVAWGRLAEIVEQHVRKGDRVHIDGALRHSTSKGDDGTKRHWVEVAAREVLFLGRANG